jgi:hypothetical protein
MMPQLLQKNEAITINSFLSSDDEIMHGVGLRDTSSLYATDDAEDAEKPQKVSLKCSSV